MTAAARACADVGCTVLMSRTLHFMNGPATWSPGAGLFATSNGQVGRGLEWPPPWTCASDAALTRAALQRPAVHPLAGKSSVCAEGSRASPPPPAADVWGHLQDWGGRDSASRHLQEAPHLHKHPVLQEVWAAPDGEDGWKGRGLEGRLQRHRERCIGSGASAARPNAAPACCLNPSPLLQPGVANANIQAGHMASNNEAIVFEAAAGPRTTRDVTFSHISVMQVGGGWGVVCVCVCVVVGGCVCVWGGGGGLAGHEVGGEGRGAPSAKRAVGERCRRPAAPTCCAALGTRSSPVHRPPGPVNSPPAVQPVQHSLCLQLARRSLQRHHRAPQLPGFRWVGGCVPSGRVAHPPPPSLSRGPAWLATPAAPAHARKA